MCIIVAITGAACVAGEEKELPPHSRGGKEFTNTFTVRKGISTTFKGFRINNSPAAVLGLGLIDAQRVVVPLDLQSRALPHLLAFFQPFHSRSQPRVDLAWNQNARVRLVLCLGHPNPNTDLTHSRSLRCSSDWSTVVPASRSCRSIDARSRGGCRTSRCIWPSHHISHELLLSRCWVHRAIHLYNIGFDRQTNPSSPCKSPAF